MKARRKLRIRPLLLTLFGGVVPLLAGFLLAAPGAQAASLTEVTAFGANPGNLRMYEYVPASAGARPPVVVAVHYCTGTGPAFHSGTEFASLADRYGFIVVYPDANVSGQCFDVSSPQALRHDGGSDPTSIASMVRSVVQRHGADADRVYVAGASSGAMMTNVLLGAYPDVFKAGASFSGVPFGCFATTDGSGWNSACANGLISRTPQQWGDLVRAAYPGYAGPRPRVQLWHGATDTTLHHNNLGEAVKQWTDVLGVSRSPVLTDNPQPGWNRTRYGAGGTQAPVEAISLPGVGHSLPTSGMAARAIAFFGLDQATPPTSPPPTTPAPSGACRVTNTVSAWNTGLTDNITVTNTGTSALNGWTLTFTLRSGQTITSGWNATFSPTSGAVTARNVGHNGTLAPGASTSIGFQATHTGDAGAPTGFRLNGSACQAG
ncbi:MULTISPECIES: PHB depolymerase family esterase [Streptomyces]|uniref:extracellular catalytic domain type 1 short-chain-length polyhydroxyalkanoate depolymerase n=1 Tax=Streptomyces TaxID=1883 RepID=UPI000AE60FC6|nr:MULTISPECIES: PHB depolymerase family esterase [Streptomyces]MDH6228281.1 acetylxylan esterase [Streptomyces sp. MJP52]